jgi:hypothetical protein
MGVFLLAIIVGSFAVGAVISVALTVFAGVLMVRAAKWWRRVWWIFGIITALVFPCVILFVNSRPPTVKLPDSIDGKNLILNCVAYGASLGIAAGVGCLVSLVVGRFRHSPTVASNVVQVSSIPDQNR